MRIHALAAVLSFAVLVGCGGGSSSSTTPPVTPTDPSIVVTSPAAGATVQGAPVQIGINAKNLVDPSKLTIYLNGVDVTSQFPKPGIAGNITAQINQPTVQYGKNQIRVSYDTLTTDSTFLLDTKTGTDPTAPGSPINSGAAPLVPIQTRVLITADADPSVATNWGVQVGTSGAPNSHFYASKAPIDENYAACSVSCKGFQILLLNRLDLSLVSNDSYEVDDEFGWYWNSPFIQELEAVGAGPNDPSTIIDGLNTSDMQQPAPQGCVHFGCIMVMQSLGQIGDTGSACYNPSAPGVCPSAWAENDPQQYHANLIYWLTKIGASADVLFANGSNPHVGYSFIGNVGSGRMPGQGTTGIVNTNTIKTLGGNGSQFDRLGCSDTSGPSQVGICDSLNWAGASNSDPIGTPGQLTGVLIHDNWGLFTFSENAPPITYTFGTTIQGGSPQTSLTINGWLNYSMAMPAGSGGGFWLLILNRTTPDWQDGKKLSKYYNLDPASLVRLANDINNNPDANNLFFLASMGNITHDAEDSNIAPAWEALVQAVQRIGADTLTFRILGEHHQGYPAFNADGKDDYLLVGKPVVNTPPAFENFTAGMPSHFTALESGYVIARQTQVNPAWPTQVAGTLQKDRQGYYTPTLQASINPLTSVPFIQPIAATIANASVLNSVPWPYSSTPAEQQAYTDISLTLCCSDIRAAYSSANSVPSDWLSPTLSYPLKNDPNPPYTAEDFNNVYNQLVTEWDYLNQVNMLYNNISVFNIEQQANMALILQQAQDAIGSDIYNSSIVSSKNNTESIFSNDVIPALGDLVGVVPVVGTTEQNALGLTSIALNIAQSRSDDPSGASQVQQALADEQIEGADLAKTVANQFTDTVSTLGNDFDRLVSDWGRLSAVGAPLKANELPWDKAAFGTYLRAADLSARRRFFTTLMAGNSSYYSLHIPQVAMQYVTTPSSTCPWQYFHQAQDANYTGTSSDGEQDFTQMTGTAWYPGTINSRNTNYWDVWVIGGKHNLFTCPVFDNHQAFPDMHGMFLPVATDGAGDIDGLGMWRPYVFQYSGFALSDIVR